MNETFQEPLKPRELPEPTKRASILPALQVGTLIAVIIAIMVWHFATRPTILGVWEALRPATHPDGRIENVVLRYEFRGNPLLRDGTGLFTARQIVMPFKWHALPGNEIVMDYAEKDGFHPTAQIYMTADGNRMRIDGLRVHFRGDYQRKR